MSSHRSARRIAAAGVLAVACGLAGACSSSDDSGSDATTTTAAKATTTTKAGPAEITVLVTNDDGVAADGIDTVAAALNDMANVKVVVVAPAANQSGTGAKTTDGPLTVTVTKTKSGIAARAVDGYPADSVRVALEDLGVVPDLVVSGINMGQNMGVVVDQSGTVGAARAAAAEGIPALAVSSGLNAEPDYTAAVPFVLNWIGEHRGAIASGEAEAVVANINVPTCGDGEVRDLSEATLDSAIPAKDAVLATSDCTSSAAATGKDVTDFKAGFATITEPLPTSAG